ncbi:MAG: hypothetical protein IAF94_02800 [Pirellulaceae bacterium]|nr:hypothetical protein [Pirellulaceae bacterium]
MASRPPVTTADYMVVALSPTLIFFLVGSLCFYLVEVFYQGQYEYRLLFVMGMFVMGIVALSRMAMEEGWAYAFLYAVGLAVVVGIALATFIQIRGPLAPFGLFINLGLMALIWWSAYKLVWDCTLMDEDQDSSGEGLLQSIGLDRMNGETSAPAVKNAARLTDPQEALSTQEVISQRESAGNPQPEIDGTPEARLFDWFHKLLEPDRRPHAPGKWVIYFSLAALPLFGLGQWFIPVENLGSRRFAFWMMAIYVASGLLLLLNTSFLGLRRYLRQRRLEMPLDMAATWLTVGTVMVAALLLLVYILPSPSPEYSLSQLDVFKSRNYDSSNYSPGGPEGSQKGESQQKADGENAEKQGGDKSENKGGGDQSGDKSGPNKGGQNNEAEQQGDSKSGDKGGGKQQGKNGEKGKSEQGEKGDGEKGKGKKGDQSDQGKDQSQDKQSPSKSQSGSKGGKSSKSQNGKSDKQNQDSKNEENLSQGKPPAKPPSNFQPSNLLARIPSSLGTILKWLFYAAIIIAALVFAYIYRKELLAAWNKLLAELRELWARWFGAKPETALSPQAVLAASPRRFSSFDDPFASGMAARVPLPELVRYSFEALEAWGRDRASPRATGQTPHEFTQQLGDLDTTVSREVKQLADLYCQIAYARALPAGGIELVRGFWQRMGGTGRAA